MDKSQITTLALNILSTSSSIRASGIHIPEMKPCILCKQKFISHPDEPIKEFTMATCGCLYHQKCLEEYLLNIAKTRAKLMCPNWNCKVRDIETLISPDLFKEMDKPTTSTEEDTATKQVDSENQTPVDEDVDITLVNELGLLDGEAGQEENASKTTDQTRPVENTSSAFNNPEILNENSSASKALTLQDIPMDDVVNENTPQIQRPICEKCSEEISIDFQKDTVFLSCSHAVHLDCINDLRKRCPTCTSADDMENDDLETPDPSDVQKKRPNDSGESTEKSSSKKVKKAGEKKVSGMLKKLIEELSSETSQDSEVMEEGTGDFFDLYNTIINMEGQEEIAKRDVIKSYYNFGKALEGRYGHYTKNNPKRTAQALVNKEVRNQLPDTVSDDALRKKKERAIKIYELFNEIGEDKIYILVKFAK